MAETKLQSCTFYNSPPGCKSKNVKGCPALHICRYYLSGKCKYGSGCKRSHNILDPQPKLILERFDWDVTRGSMSLLADIRESMNASENSCGTRAKTCKLLVPEVCKFYNKDGCRHGKSCSKLHVCYHYIINNCRNGQRCTRSHNIYDDQPKCVLLQNKWDVERSPKEVLSDLRNSMPKREESLKVQTADDHSTGANAIDVNPKMSQNIKYDDDYVPRVCVYYLSGICHYKDKCLNKHTNNPYFWQYSDKEHGKIIWSDCMKDDQATIEQCYTHPENSSSTFHLDLDLNMKAEIHFNHMTYTARNVNGKVRRLGTFSWGESALTRPYVTKWLWYWQDVNTKWQWFWQDVNTKWLEYGVEEGVTHKLCNLKSREIEEKYLENNNGEMTFKTDQFTYRLNFKDMIQENNQTGRKRLVTRRPDSAKSESVKSERNLQTIDASQNDVTYPREWVNGATSQDETYQIVEVPNGCDEYCRVEKLFLKTKPQTSVKKVQRIENKDLWEMYFRKRNKMLRHRSQSSLNELQLFHGTRQAYIDAICQQGFDWRLTGTSRGTVYGKGSYFAKDSHYSSGYTDCNTMFLVKVLVGDYTVGSSQTVRPPAKDQSNPNHNFYDSCVNDVSNPSIYVIFDQHQSYPEYIISY